VSGAAPGLDALPAARTRTPSSDTTRGAASPKDDHESMGRTTNGLPQRRRRTAATPPWLASVPPDPADPAGPTTASVPAPRRGTDNTDPQRGTDNTDAPVPGLWLAAFQNAVSGETATSGATADSRDEHQDTPQKEGER
jgi:hypothetical protein